MGRGGRRREIDCFVHDKSHCYINVLRVSKDTGTERMSWLSEQLCQREHNVKLVFSVTTGLLLKRNGSIFYAHYYTRKRFKPVAMTKYNELNKKLSYRTETAQRA